jgi:type IV fimbrial biogenesis protein FimT
MKPNCHNLHGFRTGARRSQGGFSLTELVVTVSVAAILMSVAVPSFNGVIANQRAKTLASSLYATLSKTRSEALALNGNVTLQPKAGNWGNGWQMLDANNNVLDDYTATSGITIAGPALITYRSSGRLPAGAVPMFQVSTSAGHTMTYQCVSVELSGRPYMSATQTC